MAKRSRTKATKKAKGSRVAESTQEGILMWVLSLLLLGGVITLILWLAGVFDRDESTTTGAAGEKDLLDQIGDKVDETYDWVPAIIGTSVGSVALLSIVAYIVYHRIKGTARLEPLEGVTGQGVRNLGRRMRNVGRKGAIKIAGLGEEGSGHELEPLEK